MKLLTHIFLATIFIFLVVATPPSHAQTKTQKAEGNAAAAAQSDAQKNTQAYIDLMRSDVRQQKAEMMGSVMVLSAQDAAKFWPIYSDYDTVKEALGAMTAARFAMVEHQLLLIIDLQIDSSLPVVGQGS